MNAKILTLFSLIIFFAALSQAVAAQNAASGVAAGSKASTAKSYNLELSYASGQLSPRGIVLENLAPLDHRVWPNDGWICKVEAADGTVINAFKFSLPVVVCRDQSDPGGLTGGCAAGEAANFNLNVPHHANGAAVVLYDPSGKLAFSVDTTKFAELCGNLACEAGENNLTCAKDCRSGVKDGVCDKIADGICDADCLAKDDADCAPAGLGFVGILLIVLGVILAVAVAVAGFVVWRKKSRR